MSTMAYTDSEKLYKNPTINRRNNSGELDVFEASRYFSGSAEIVAGFNSATTVSYRAMKDERPIWVGGARKSLDIPVKTPLPTHSHRQDKQMKEKKYKQPSSPGGRLASFLNSLFSQTSSKKKSKSATQSMKGEEESPGGRRKRRSSISHFQSSGSSTDTKSLYSSSSSGFRTPPPYSNTATKLHKGINSYSEHKQAVPLSKGNDHLQRPVNFFAQNKILNEKKDMGVGWFDEKFKLRDEIFEKNRIYIDGLLEKDLIYSGNGFLDKDRTWVDEFSSEKNLRRNEEVDDGAESDSSSDLFELQNYDLGVYSNGLPVYETTHIESIKRGAPIVSGTH